MQRRIEWLATIAILCLGLAEPGLADSSNPWVVTGPGTRWSYRATFDAKQKLVNGGNLPSRSHVGKAVTRIAGVAPEGGTAGEIVTLVSKVTWDGAAMPSRKQTKRSAIRNGDVFVEGPTTALDSLYLPKTPTIDSKLGPRRMSLPRGDLVLEGKIQGVQDVVTPAGTFKGCLRIRWSGRATPRAGASEGGFRLEGGEVIETMWYAKGKGLVRQITEEDLILNGPQGRFNFKARTGIELTGFEPGAQQPTSPR